LIAEFMIVGIIWNINLISNKKKLVEQFIKNNEKMRY
jgi:hypothetical protein